MSAKADAELDAEMRARFPGVWGVMSKANAVELQHTIDEEFGQVDLDEWK